MSEHAEIRFIGPLDGLEKKSAPQPWWRKPLFLSVAIIVGLPTLLAAIYFLLIASPRYVSEANFIVRRADQSGPGALGLALSGVGLSATATDTFMVHEFVKSRSAVDFLQSRHDLGRVFSPPQADPFSRAHKPWSSNTKEDLYKGVEGFLHVGYDSTTGISTIRVQAFNPKDAKNIAETLLAGGENVVNTINERSSQAAVSEAERTTRDAAARLQEAQTALTTFRNREQIVDPAGLAAQSATLLGRLMAELATLEAERRQITSETPSSPLLPTLDRRIDAFRKQIEQERAKIAGDSGSLAPKIGAYEALVFEREMATRTLAAANQALEGAQVDARRQHLFLDRIVEPNLPDKPIEPRRWLAILAIFASFSLLYGCGYLMWAGIREHRHE
ncbi:chain-length determining protein [Brevundimonas sp.]|uniref:chain-length determining protein n=1 Tax=Brevundimonas sp. TaxID=1871086 RepID=UPI0025BBF178|nr:chain-length determining protein [Brevundimonas sp.]